ncbi:uncharacterized protein AB675_3352 [Cyphellophora attinorum]|uniref:Uncharacterized protein n=1 Tax=Cyphellophora attinorum TaxID=1664694 RepID=A0A0N1P0Z0_9EURO|nr:uncharacterized protein AB675_3352 [Phialophora attinorum]KPI39836.1 hypothetical protein AB675_3352 [Phialophora attinorum]
MDCYIQDSGTVADRLEKAKHQAQHSKQGSKKEIQRAIAKLEKSMKKSTDDKILADARARQADPVFLSSQRLASQAVVGEYTTRGAAPLNDVLWPQGMYGEAAAAGRSLHAFILSTVIVCMSVAADFLANGSRQSNALKSSSRVRAHFMVVRRSLMTETKQLKESMGLECGRKLVSTATKTGKTACRRQDVDDLDRFMRSSTDVDVLLRSRDDWKALQNGQASYGDTNIGQ